MESERVSLWGTEQGREQGRRQSKWGGLKATSQVSRLILSHRLGAFRTACPLHTIDSILPLLEEERESSYYYLREFPSNHLFPMPMKVIHAPIYFIYGTWQHQYDNALDFLKIFIFFHIWSLFILVKGTLLNWFTKVNICSNWGVCGDIEVLPSTLLFSAQYH